jgi:transcriptional regulator with XRE-family HTH domain
MPEEDTIMTTFGEFFKQKRIAQGKTLREFCRDHDLDHGNISKLERGRLTPPQNDETLNKYASYLQLNVEELETFNDLAKIGNKQIPEYLSDNETLAKLPVFFRALKGSELSEDKLQTLIEMIRKS